MMTRKTKTLFHQSQLDTDGQGVLRNIWLTAARLSIAGAVSICLNMIIKVKALVCQFVLKLHANLRKLLVYL